MTDIIVRDWLVEQLTPLLPRKWNIVPVQRNVDTLSTTTVILKQQSIARLPEAPQGARVVEYLMTVAVPNQDTARGEAQLDDDVITLLDAIDQIGSALKWTTAQKVVLSDQFPAYDITLTIPYTHSKE